MKELLNLSRVGFGVPLLWMFTGGALLCLMPREPVPGENRTRWSRTAAFLLAMPMLLWAGFRSGGEDTANYIAAFYRTGTGLHWEGWDGGFSALMALSRALGLGTHSDFFLLVAAVQVLCMTGVFYRYSVCCWTSIFLFIASTDYLSWMENGMRQFLAVCLTFAAFPLLVEGKWLRYAAAVLLASTVHLSALLMLPVGWVISEGPLGRRTRTMLAVSLGAAVLSEQAVPLLEAVLAWTPYAGVTHGGIWTADDGTNPLRVLVYSVPALLALAGGRRTAPADRATAMCINASLVTMGLYCFSGATSGVYMGRLPIYTTLHGYIALPWLLDRLFTRPSARLLRGIMIGCYLIFYWYQLRVAWGW